MVGDKYVSVRVFSCRKRTHWLIHLFAPYSMMKNGIKQINIEWDLSASAQRILRNNVNKPSPAQRGDIKLHFDKLKLNVIWNNSILGLIDCLCKSSPTTTWSCQENWYVNSVELK